MNIAMLLEELQGQGTRIWVEGGHLRCSGPGEILTAEVVGFLKRHKTELFRLLREKSVEDLLSAGSFGTPLAITQENRSLDGILLPDIVPVPRDRNIPLSFAQQRCWENQTANPNGTFYNIVFGVKLTGKLDTNVLKQSFNEMVRRHENLRTTFRVKNGSPVQIIAPEHTIEFPLEDLQGLPDRKQADRISGRIREENRHSFDLVEGPLMRISLMCLAEESHVLLISVHHIIVDVDSIKVFFEELSELYKAFLNHSPCPQPELPVQYADYAYWQHRDFLPKVLEDRLHYWKQWLAKEPQELKLQFDRPRPAKETFRSGFKKHQFSPPLTREIKELGLQSGSPTCWRDNSRRRA